MLKSSKCILNANNEPGIVISTSDTGEQDRQPRSPNLPCEKILNDFSQIHNYTSTLSSMGERRAEI